MTTASKILNTTRSYLGVTQGSSAHLAIVAKYNSFLPLPQGYKVKATDDWCDVFVSVMGIEAGATDLIGRECGVQRHIDIFKSLGIWYEDGAIAPLPGDIICYNWDDGTQPNDGWADHIGCVESIGGGTITTIEGNTSRMVKRRTVPVGYGYIRGFARPKYSGGESSQKTITEVAKEVIAGTWGNGTDRIAKLTAAGYSPSGVQAEVNRLLGTSSNKPTIPQIEVDGDWGAKTTSRIQQVLGLVVDGILGKNTIMAIQRIVGLTGDAVDGLMGPVTIRAMQRYFGTVVDGIISKPSLVVRTMQARLNQGKF